MEIINSICYLKYTLKGFQKIISLLPSATEIIYCVDLQERLKGVTHTCTFHSDTLSKPKIIAPSFDVNKLDSLEIDKKIKQLALLCCITNIFS